MSAIPRVASLRASVSQHLIILHSIIGALHEGPHQNQAIAQKLGILGEKVTSMTGLRIQKYLLGPTILHDDI